MNAIPKQTKQAFKIEKGVPMPRALGAVAQYPLRDMEVGDSFLIPLPDGLPIAKLQSGLGGTLHYAKKRWHRKFATRRVAGGVRVWRVA